MPFFNSYLKSTADPKLPEAFVFETGRNQWQRHDAWPPKAARMTPIYLHAGGKLGWGPPADTAAAFDEYVSDPAKPVPYTASVAIGMTQEHMVGDQRFAATRPDVLTYETDRAALPVRAAADRRAGPAPSDSRGADRAVAPAPVVEWRHAAGAPTGSEHGTSVNSARGVRAETPPMLSSRRGIVFACEIYAVFPKEYLGVRVEDTIVITETGRKNLTPGLPRTVAEIEAFMRKQRFGQWRRHRSGKRAEQRRSRWESA